MKWLAFLLFLLLLAIQYPLWWGKGSWSMVNDYEKLLNDKRRTVQEMSARNAGLEAEVLDLKQGLDVIEERARIEFNLIEPTEHYWSFPTDADSQPTPHLDSLAKKQK